MKNYGQPGVLIERKRSDKVPEIVFCRICLWNTTWYALHGNHNSYIS